MGSQPANNLENLKEHLTYDKLEALRTFWFEHLPQGASRIPVAPEHHNRWFFPGKEFDYSCVTQFGPILEAVRNSGVTSGQEILSIAQPRNPLDWPSLIILLDEITRNSYRGDKVSVCFMCFDHLALQLSLQAIKRGIPDTAPEIQDLPTHIKAGLEFEQMNQDILSLLDGTGGADEHEKRARDVVQADPEAAMKMGETNREFEEKHLMIIEKFGRYAHRNQALGREPTSEETGFLQNGGDTFGG